MNYREEVAEGLQKSKGLTPEQVAWATSAVDLSIGNRTPRELSEVESKRLVMETVAMLRAISRMPAKLRLKMQARLDVTVAKVYPRA